MVVFKLVCLLLHFFLLVSLYYISFCFLKFTSLFFCFPCTVICLWKLSFSLDFLFYSCLAYFKLYVLLPFISPYRKLSFHTRSSLPRLYLTFTSLPQLYFGRENILLLLLSCLSSTHKSVQYINFIQQRCLTHPLRVHLSEIRRRMK